MSEGDDISLLGRRTIHSAGDGELANEPGAGQRFFEVLDELFLRRLVGFLPVLLGVFGSGGGEGGHKKTGQRKCENGRVLVHGKSPATEVDINEGGGGLPPLYPANTQGVL